MKSSKLRWGLLVTTAAVLAATGVVFGAPSASAAVHSVSVSYRCQALGMTRTVDAQMTVTGPQTVTLGSTATLQMAVTLGATSPFTLPAHSISGTAALTMAGASRGEVEATGLTNPEPIRAGSMVILQGGTATVRLGHLGTTTLTPADLRFSAMGMTGQCTPARPAPEAASIEVTAA